MSTDKIRFHNAFLYWEYIGNKPLTEHNYLIKTGTYLVCAQGGGEEKDKSLSLCLSFLNIQPKLDVCDS